MVLELGSNRGNPSRVTSYLYPCLVISRPTSSSAAPARKRTVLQKAALQLNCSRNLLATTRPLEFTPSFISLTSLSISSMN